MNFKSLATATIALSMLAGTAIAQQAPAGTAPTGTAPTSQGAPSFASDNERMMYEENRASWSGFFTDETMATLKTDQEVKDTFAAMDADSQAGMKSACEKAASDRGSYGTVTNALCDSVMKM